MFPYQLLAPSLAGLAEDKGRTSSFWQDQYTKMEHFPLKLYRGGDEMDPVQHQLTEHLKSKEDGMFQVQCHLLQSIYINININHQSQNGISFNRT